MATIDVISSGMLSDLTPSVIDTYTVKIEKGEWVGQETTTLGIELRPTVVKWYYTIRNFALIVMMVILLYIGIRIMLCGISSEKAKYKSMLMDWVIAICLIFIMHYIMAFSMNIVDGISKIFGSVNTDAGLSAKQKEEYVVLYEEDATVISKLKDAGIDVSGLVSDGVITWDAKNMLGMVRVSAALSNSGSYLYIGYVMCYIVMVIFTVFFMFTYLKRALYLTFFTIIAPFVAMTYPLDKLHDGKAQAFDMWLKEYIFNLMIQPVHLLLYTVLISSAITLAQENILYTLVAIGFMMPAEKFLRKMFGFDKAQTPGFLSGAAGTALMVTGFNKLFNRKPSKGGSGIGDGGGSSGGKAIGSDDAGTIDLTDNASLMQKLGKEDKPKDPREDELDKPKPKPEPPKNPEHKLPPGFLPNGELDMSYLYSLSGKGDSSSMSSDVQEEISKLQKYQAEKYQKSLKGRASKLKGKVGSKYSKFKGAVGKKLSPAVEYSKNYVGQMLRRSSNDIANGKPIRTIANTAKGIYGALAGSMIATTIALTDDNPTKQIVSNNSTLAAAAFALGSRESKPNYDQEEAFEAAKRARYNSEEEYQKALREEQTKKVIENEKNLRKVRDYLGDEFNIKTLEDAQAFMEKHSEFIDAGYEDMDNFCTLAKLVESGQMDKTMAATTAKYYKKAGGKPKSLGKKEKENIQFICENIAKSSGITDKAEIEKSVNIMFNNLNLYGDTMDGFKSL